jgi:hypothetical protein
MTAHAQTAARAICGRDAGELHRLAMRSQPEAPHDAAGGSYETWRTRLACELAQQGAA